MTSADREPNLGINFKNLGTPSPDGGLIIPREIFNALPSKVSKLDYLRESQGVVLDRWFERRTERDLVIKMNTGGGKTLSDFSCSSPV